MSKKNMKVLDHFSILTKQGGRNNSVETEHCLKNLIHRIPMEKLNVKETFLCTVLSMPVVPGRNVSFIILSKSRKHGLDWLFFSPTAFVVLLESFF